MMARACRFYGWRLDYVLDMPASQFFAMFRCIPILYSEERYDEVEIAAIPMCKAEWWEAQRSKFRRPGTLPKTIAEKTPDTLHWKDPKAISAIRGIFLAKKESIHGG